MLLASMFLFRCLATTDQSNHCKQAHQNQTPSVIWTILVIARIRHSTLAETKHSRFKDEIATASR